MKGREKAQILIPDDIAHLIRNMHPQLKSVIRKGLQSLIDEPFLGKALKEELDGLRSFRVKKFRIIYRLSPKGSIEVVALGPRKHIYEETFMLISKEKK